MSEDISTPPAAEAIAVPYADFKAGLPVGRYRIIMNPKKAYRYVLHRLFVNGVSVPMIGIGIALVISGYVAGGLCLGAVGLGLRHFVKTQAPKILLYLAQNNAKIYYDTIEYEIMEVRAAQD